MPATTELPRTYDPAAVEAETYKVWMDERRFVADPSDPGDPYCIVIPPPNVTGALHLGHAINNTLQDILTRVHRMRGHATLWVPGIDHAGIATQAVVEKQLKENENKTRHDVGREALVQRIWDWKQQYGDRIVSQLKRLGCSCDWSRQRFTLDDTLARAVRETFFKLFKDGLIYRGKRLVNWDVHLQTSISDDEIYHETVKTFLWHIRYPIVDQGPVTATIAGPLNDNERDPSHGAVVPDFPYDPDSRVVLSTDAAHAENTPKDRPTHMTVATTRPETLLGDTAVAVHSEDPRWNWAIGKFVRLPLTGRLIPIIADDILVDPKFGSGVVKVTPAHDPNDYAVWQRHQGQADAIEIVNLLNPDGALNENAGPAYKGLKRDAARKKVVDDLKAQGLLAKEEPYETEVGHSDRSKTPVEPYLSDQWFVKMAPLAEPALDVVRRGVIQFFPERHAQQYLSWLGEKRDWPISRQLWWGHRIPVWTGKWSQAFADYISRHDIAGNIATFRLDESDDKVTHPALDYACVRPGHEEIEQKLVSLGFVQDPDVLDTWFSSALWPHSTLGWPDDTADLKKWYPTSVLLTGRDIITLWVARMVMTGMYNMGRPASSGSPHEEYFKGRGTANVGNFDEYDRADDFTLPTAGRHHVPPAEPADLDEARRLGIPFRHVVINPTILDGKGERMSKSKGNGVDPVDIIDTHGADALRLTLATMATETQDARLPVRKDSQGRNTSDKFDLGRNFATKLWNACRFAFAGLEAVAAAPASPSSAAATLADRWIVSRFNRTVQTANDALAVYRFDQYAKACYDFFWNDLCAWYLEAIKPAMNDPARAPQTATVLAAVLDGSLRLLHPVIPFITEKVWWRLNEVRPRRGLPGLLECEPSERLIVAAWPTVGPFDDGAEHVFPRLQDVITAIRNVKSEAKAEAKKIVTVSLAPPGAEAAGVTEANRELIESLAYCTIKAIRPNLTPPPGAVRVSINTCDVYVEGLADPAAQAQLSAKKRDDLTRQIATLEGRLSNEAYLSKAPPNLVEQTKQQLAEAKAELAKLG